MRIEPVGHTTIAIPEASRSAQRSESAPAVAPDPRPTESQTKTPGVIRLLESGHFQGVADVRLRINFHEELSARAAARASQAAGPAALSLIDSVQKQIDEIVAPLPLDDTTLSALEALTAGFAEAVTEGATLFANGSTSSAETLSGSIQAAFDALLTGLNDLLSSAAPSAPSHPAGDANSNPESTSLTDALATLSETFGAALTRFSSDLGTAAALPELSPPHGNGAAYEKFLATYQSLQGAANPDRTLA